MAPGWSQLWELVLYSYSYHSWEPKRTACNVPRYGMVSANELDMKSPGQWDGAAVNSLVRGSKTPSGHPPWVVRDVQYCLVKFIVVY